MERKPRMKFEPPTLPPPSPAPPPVDTPGNLDHKIGLVLGGRIKKGIQLNLLSQIFYFISSQVSNPNP